MLREAAGHVDLEVGGRLLARYVHRPAVPESESPRPYFHPLVTLAGDTVTDFQPADHGWHHGLSLTCANLSGQNFWGGRTYVRDQGYVMLDDHGRVEHEGWEAPVADRLVEHLRWIARSGETWIEEHREVAPAWIDEDRGDWALEFVFRLRNVSGRTLEFRTPTTEGRPQAGYGGLFWRAPMDFVGGRVRAPGHPEGTDLMGKRAPWLAFTGRHDESGRESTLLFVDHPRNPRYPNQWFVRSESYAGAAFALAFDEPYRLEPETTLTLHYRVAVIAGDPGPDRLAELAGRPWTFR